jgi:transcriptional regulator with XRE-family HTH domain
MVLSGQYRGRIRLPCVRTRVCVECHLTDVSSLPVYDPGELAPTDSWRNSPTFCFETSLFFWKRKESFPPWHIMHSDDDVTINCRYHPAHRAERDRRLILPEGAKLRSELAVSLKFLRQRVDPDVCNLGPYARLPSRVGNRVTQAELAEAIGVSREWCAVLETAGSTRASTRLLNRIADALMVTPEERARLFSLALPEMGRAQLRLDTVEVLEAFSRLKSFTKALWTATSVEDILTTACEGLGDWFDGALLISTTRRTASGLWEYPLNEERGRNDAAKVAEDIGQLPPELQTAINTFPGLLNAGDIGTPETNWTLPLRRTIERIYARRRLAGFAWIYARVRSRAGFIGGLYIGDEFGRSYSPSDRAVLGALAEFTSLALS